MKIAVFTKNLTNPAYGAARLGADRAAAALGAQAIHYVPQKPDDAAQQSALIEQALAGRPDAVVLSPVHEHLVDAAIRKVAAAGIPLVGFVNPIKAVASVSYVDSDDTELALAIAKYLFGHMGGQGNVLAVSGHPHSVTSRDRMNGFDAAAASQPGINVVGRVAGDYERATARAVTAQWLADHPQAALHGCLVANDIMALGVLEALRAAGRSVPVVGVNAIPEAIGEIRAGSMLATADFNAMKMGYLATECAVRHLHGEVVPGHVRLPVQIVDRNNCELWDLPYERRAIITLEELRQ